MVRNSHQLFSEFCRAHNIQHLRSPPYHPQSNGQAERFVDMFKRALLKCQGEGTTTEATHRFLWVYRSTPHRGLPNQQAPAEALVGRELRTTLASMLPTKATSLPEPSREHSPLTVGSHVWVRDHRPGKNPWTRGQIVTRRGSVLYEVNVADGTWVRHRNQIRPASANPQPEYPVAPSIPLDILLDTFGTPASPTATNRHLNRQHSTATDKTNTQAHGKTPSEPQSAALSRFKRGKCWVNRLHPGFTAGGFPKVGRHRSFPVCGLQGLCDRLPHLPPHFVGYPNYPH